VSYGFQENKGVFVPSSIVGGTHPWQVTQITA